MDTDDWDAPMELVYTHELEKLREDLRFVQQERDALRAQFRQWQQPFTYSSGSYTVPEWLRDVRVLQ